MTKLVQFRFGEKGIQIIENLKKDLDFSSRAEVMRLSLNLLNWTDDCLKDGYEIIAIKSDGVEMDKAKNYAERKISLGGRICILNKKVGK